MNWADDVNYMFTDLDTAVAAIDCLVEVAEELDLPFSKAKCKLIPIYPRKYPQKDKVTMGTQFRNTVTITEEAKILGTIWSQPRYYRGRPQMFK